MIRVYTDHALGRKLRRHRRDLAAQLADAIGTLTPLPCKHRDGRDLPTCARCAERRAVKAAIAVVRETGGIAP